MKKYILVNLLIGISIILKAQNLNYFSIGSSENSVLQIQGQPTSISRIGLNSTFFYGSSYVSFTNRRVDGYFDNGNLKIRINGTKSKTIKRKINKPREKINKDVKWVYFSILSDEPSQLTFDKFSDKIEFKSNIEYTPLYSISGYTFEMQQNLEFCLTKEYKKSTGKNSIFVFHIYDNREAALFDWNNEKGHLNSIWGCSYLNNYGVFEH